MVELSSADLRVRTSVYDMFARGSIPLIVDVADIVGTTATDVRESYARLAERHVLVLQPGSGEVWMAMPFSAVETPFRVEGGNRAWWANCAWDALGIAAALEIDVRVATRCPDCDARIDIAMESGRVHDSGLRCHFAIPARRWWDDIAET